MPAGPAGAQSGRPAGKGGGQTGASPDSRDRPGDQRPRGSRLLPRNWRVRSKLVAVLVVPAVAFLVVAGINLNTSINNARNYGEGADIAGFGQQVTGLAHALQEERDLTNGLLSAQASGQSQSTVAAGTCPRFAMRSVTDCLPRVRSSSSTTT